MMSRRPFRRGPVRRFRNRRIIWDRFQLTSPFSGAVVDGFVIGDPTVLPASSSGFDMDRIYRGSFLMFNHHIKQTVALDAIGQILWGVYLGDPTQTVRRPDMATANDTNQDWLALGSMDIETQGINVNFHNVGTGQLSARIKTKRKVSLSDAIIFAYQLNSPTVPIILQAGNITVNVSSVWDALPR